MSDIADVAALLGAGIPLGAVGHDAMPTPSDLLELQAAYHQGRIFATHDVAQELDVDESLLYKWSSAKLIRISGGSRPGLYPRELRRLQIALLCYRLLGAKLPELLEIFGCSGEPITLGSIHRPESAASVTADLIARVDYAIRSALWLRSQLLSYLPVADPAGWAGLSKLVGGIA